MSLASAWQEAAPTSVIDNLYGSSEASGLHSSYRWNPLSSTGECIQGVVPLGWSNPGQSAIVVDDQLNCVPLGAAGEICISGSQVATAI